MRILSFLALGVAVIGITTSPAANAADLKFVGGKCSPNGVVSTSGPNGTGAILMCKNGAWNGPSATYGTATISLRSGHETQSAVIGIGGMPIPFETVTEIPYVASISSVSGKKPVKTEAVIRDGLSGAISAEGQQNGHVALKIHLVDTSLIKMGHYTAPDGKTIDIPETHTVSVDNTIYLADGQSAPLVLSGKTIGTVSWSVLNPR